jgi:parallel beta-helix repeat protein
MTLYLKKCSHRYHTVKSPSGDMRAKTRKQYMQSHKSHHMCKTEKTLAMLLVLLSLLSLALLPSSTVKAQTRTLIVPDQYPTVQAAVGNATSGDIVYVKEGTYCVEGLTVDKSITLLGQDRQTTIIDSTGNIYDAGSVIDITANAVALSGFTINANAIPRGIYVQGNDCEISNNIIENASGPAIDTYATKKTVIISNSITGNGAGIYLASSDSTISNNSLTDNNGVAITIDSCENVTVSQNHISGNGDGVLIRFIGPFYIYGNDIADNSGFGIQFGQNCSNSMVYDNSLSHNQIGVDLMNFATTTALAPLRVDGYPLGTGNVVYNNHFTYNTINAYAEPSFPYDVGYVNNGTDVVSWDNGLVGNYWSDYLNPFAYVIDANNVDHHPLPFLSAHIIALITSIVIAVVVVLLLYRKHRKTADLKQWPFFYRPLVWVSIGVCLTVLLGTLCRNLLGVGAQEQQKAAFYRG